MQGVVQLRRYACAMHAKQVRHKTRHEVMEDDAKKIKKKKQQQQHYQLSWPTGVWRLTMVYSMLQTQSSGIARGRRQETPQ